jgi:hypothetical protein
MLLLMDEFGLELNVGWGHVFVYQVAWRVLVVVSIFSIFLYLYIEIYAWTQPPTICFHYFDFVLDSTSFSDPRELCTS